MPAPRHSKWSSSTGGLVFIISGAYCLPVPVVYAHGTQPVSWGAPPSISHVTTLSSHWTLPSTGKSLSVPVGTLAYLSGPQAHRPGQAGSIHSLSRLMTNVSTSMTTASPGTVQLDLTSARADIALPSALIKSGGVAIIEVGGLQKTFHNGDFVTPAELVAIEQTSGGHGRQTIIVDASGVAAGGSLSLNQVMSHGTGLQIGSITIAKYVVATELVTAHSSLKLIGELVNYGSIQETGGGPHASLTISAKDLLNEPGAQITTVSTPAGGYAAGDAKNNADLTITAGSSLLNEGSIASGGSLNISASTVSNHGSAASIVANSNLNIRSAGLTNSGTLQSIAGNSKLEGITNSGILVSNQGGTISAQNGTITLTNHGTGVSSITGGNLLSQSLNLQATTGTINVDVDELTGVVTSTGNAVHVQANTQNLVLGKQSLSGDPTYYNSSGSITLTNNITANEDLTIIAAGDILAQGTCNLISTTDGGGQGHDITIVAGANVIGVGGDTPTLPTAGSATSATFSGASTTGGSVNLSNAASNLAIVSGSTSGNKSGANVTIAAYSGSGGGVVNLPSASVINASGAGIGVAGNATIVAPTAISIEAVSTGSNVPAVSKLEIVGSQPIFSSGTSIGFKSDGSISSGNYIVPDYKNISAAGITVGGAIAAAGDVAITTNATTSFAGNVTAGRSISVASRDTITFNGFMSAIGGITLVSGHNVQSTPGSNILSTVSASATPGNVTVIAGAAFTQDSGQLTVTGGSTTGGQINLAGAQIDTRSLGATLAPGGQVTAVAFAGSDNTGNINLNGSKIMTGGGGLGGASGDVTIMGAGPVSGTAINLTGAQIDTTGGAFNTGNVTMYSQTPYTTINETIDRSTGLVTGSFINMMQDYFAGGAVGLGLVAADIVPGSVTTNHATLTMATGNSVTLNGTPATNSNLTVISGNNITVSGAINTTDALALLSVGTGDILIGADLKAAGGLALLTDVGNIRTTVSGLTISTSSTTGDSGAMTIVAGDYLYWYNNQVEFVQQNFFTSTANIDFASNPVTALTSASSTGAGGNIIMCASGGNLNLQVVGLTIQAGGSGSGANGSVLLGGRQVFAPEINSSGGKDGTNQIILASGVEGLFSFFAPLGTNTTFVALGNAAGTLTSTPQSLFIEPFAAGVSFNYSLVADKITSPGARIEIHSDSIEVNTIDASSPAGGGQVKVFFSNSAIPLTLGAQTLNFIGSINVSGGANGNGGTILVQDGYTNNNTGPGIIITDMSKFNFGAAAGTGGSFELHTVGQVSLPTNKISTTPTVSGAGGNLEIQAQSVSWAGSNTLPLILDASGTAGGKAGFVTLGLNASTPVSINNTAGAFELLDNGGGNGLVQILIPNAPVTISNAGFSNLGGPNLSNARIIINVSSLIADPTQGGPVVLNVNGHGKAQAANLVVTTTAAKPLTIGTAKGDFEIFSQSGDNATSGLVGFAFNGVTINSGGDLTVDTNALKMTSQNPLAPIVDQGHLLVMSLTAGGSGQGNLKVTGSLGNALAGGAAYNIKLQSDSAQPFIIGGAGINSISGAPVTSGNPSGTLTVVNTGGSIQQNVGITDVGSVTYTAGGANGSITISKGLGDANLRSSSSTGLITLTASQAGTIKATGATVADTLTANSGKGAITISDLTANHLTATTSISGGAVTITNSGSLLDVKSATGGSLSITSNGSIGTSGTIQSNGNITLASNAKSPAYIDVGADLTSGGIAKITTAGQIIASGVVTGTIGVTETSTTESISYSKNIVSGANGTVTLTANQGMITDQALDNIDGGKAVVLNSTAGSINVGTIGANTAPASLMIKSLAGFIAGGDIKAGKTVSIATTAKTGGNIALLGGLIASTAGSTIVITSTGGTFSALSTTTPLTGGTVTISGAGGVTLDGTVTSALKTLTVTASAGDISLGSSAALNATVADAKVTALNNFFDSGTITAATAIKVATTGTSAANVLNAGTMTTSAGPISIVGAGGLVATNTGAIITAASATKTKATLLIEDSNKSAGHISIDGTLSTSLSGGSTVTIAIGAAPTGGKNAFNTTGNITVQNIGSGKVYADGSQAAIIGPAATPVANLISKNANLILFSPAAANTITFASGSSVQADPPASAPTLAPHPSATYSASSSSSVLDKQPSQSTAGEFILLPPSQASTLSVLSATSISAQLISAQTGSSLASLANQTRLVDFPNLEETSTDRSSGTAWISETELAGGIIPGAILKHGDRSIESPYKLKAGTILVCPDQDALIETGSASVHVAKGSLALVAVMSHGTAVYNLHDSKRGAVKMRTEHSEIEVPLGNFAMLSTDDRTFEYLNPAQLVEYRAVSEKTEAAGVRLFRGQYSLMSAARLIQPLRTMLKQNDATKCGNIRAFLKTAAIITPTQNMSTGFRLTIRPTAERMAMAATK